MGIGFTHFRDKRLNIVSVRIDDVSSSVEPGRFIEISADGVLVSTGQGSICLQRVQPEGKPVLDALSWARGARLKPNELFG